MKLVCGRTNFYSLGFTIDNSMGIRFWEDKWRAGATPEETFT